MGAHLGTPKQMQRNYMPEWEVRDKRRKELEELMKQHPNSTQMVAWQRELKALKRAGARPPTLKVALRLGPGT